MSLTTDTVDQRATTTALCCTPEAVPLLDAGEADRVAGMLKAIGHPIRLQMMHILSRLGGHVCVCEIEAQFDVKQPTVSHHLRKLKDAGLVEVEQRGLYAYYRIRPEAVSLLQRLLRSFVR